MTKSEQHDIRSVDPVCSPQPVAAMQSFDPAGTDAGTRFGTKLVVDGMRGRSKRQTTADSIPPCTGAQWPLSTPCRASAGVLRDALVADVLRESLVGLDRSGDESRPSAPADAA